MVRPLVWLFSLEDGSMSRKRPKPEEIVGMLRPADVLISQGQSVTEVICTSGVSEVSHLLHTHGNLPGRLSILASTLDVYC